MAYVALKRQKFGDGYLEPGDSVPVEPGRSYRVAVRLGLIAELPEESLAGGNADEDELGKLNRAKLNELADAYGIDDAQNLPNKQAVVDAIRTAQDAAGE